MTQQQLTPEDFLKLSQEMDEEALKKIAGTLDVLIDEIAKNTPEETEHMAKIKEEWENSNDKLGTYLRQRRTIITLQMRELRYLQEKEEMQEEIELLRSLNN